MIAMREEGVASQRAAQRRIAALPAEQREVLLLVCVENMAYREAAELLDIPVATIIGRLIRARRSIIAEVT